MPTTHPSGIHSTSRRWAEAAGRGVLNARAGLHGGLCEIDGRRRGQSASHIVAAGRGGTWAPSNLLWTCGSGTTGCHGWLEHHPDEAAAGGWHIRRTTRVPGEIPVWLRIPYSPGGAWWLLDDDGLYVPADLDQTPLLIDPAERPDLYVLDGQGGVRPARLPEGAAA